jgi:uncharacterized protein (TIGR02597 family)
MNLRTCLALLLAPGCLLAIEASSPISGFVTLPLAEGINFVGFPLLPGAEVQGTVTIDAGDRRVLSFQAPPPFALSNGQFNTLPAAPSHVTEVASTGTGQGFFSSITATAALNNTITLADPIPAGVNDGVVVRVWKLWTIADAFGVAAEGGLTGGTTPDLADLILLPSGSGYDRYFYSMGGAQGVGWRRVGGGTDNQASQTLPFADGFAISSRSGKVIQIVGMVKPGLIRFTLQTGRNLITNLCPVNAGGADPSPVGRTLANSGLQDTLLGGLSATQADQVLMFGNGTYATYYLSTGGPLGSGWRRVGAGSTNQGATPLPDGSFVVIRRGAPVTVQLSQESYQ